MLSIAAVVALTVIIPVINGGRGGQAPTPYLVADLSHPTSSRPGRRDRELIQERSTDLTTSACSRKGDT